MRYRSDRSIADLSRLIGRMLAASCVLTALVTGSARAEQPATMLLIDGSGSMWSRFDPDRRSKIDIVREKLTPILQNAKRADIGFASFGHRRKGDCSDTEVIIAAGPDRDAPIAELQKLNPRGKGPLVKALAETATAVGPRRPASILLLSDGPDNCQQDACAAAAEIARTSPGLAVHTIGLALDADAKQRISCISQATGGTFFDVATSDGLDAALAEASKLAMLAPDASPEAVGASASGPAPVPTPTTAALRASISLREGGASLNEAVRWRIFKSGDRTVLAESEAPELTARVDPGSYDIEGRLGEMVALKTVEAKAGQDINTVLPLDAGRIRVRVNSVEGVPASNTTTVTLASVEGGTGSSWVAPSLPAEFLVPPATYMLTIADGTARQSQKIEILAGTDKPIDIALGTGRLEISAAMSGAQSGSDDVLFIVSEDDPESPNGRRQVARSHASSADFTLPAGTYYVTARSGRSEVRERIAVGAGDVVKRAINLPLASLNANATVAGSPVDAGQGLVYRVTALDGDRAEVVRAISPALSVTLPPGRYRVDADLTAHQLHASRDITLDAGKAAAVTLDFAAAQVTFKASEASPGEHYWEVHDASGLPVWRAYGQGPTTLLAPGRYTVRLEARDVSKEAVFELASGNKLEVEIGRQ